MPLNFTSYKHDNGSFMILTGKYDVYHRSIYVVVFISPSMTRKGFFVEPYCILATE